MLHAFGEALAFIKEKPTILIGVGVLLLLQAGIALLQAPIANYFIATLDFTAVLEAFDSIQLGGFIILMLVGLIFNFAGLLWVAQHVKVWKQPSTEKTSLQLLKSAGLVTAFIVMVLGIIIGISWVLSLLLEFLGFIGIFLVGITILVMMYAIVKFTFVVALMGFGLDLKQALQQSWNLTQNHFLQALALLVGIMLITTLLDLIVQFIIVRLDTELIAIPLNFISAVLLTTYGAAVMACAIPLQEISTMARKHVHGKQRFG